MSILLFSNNSQTTLAGAITSVALTANLSPGAGVLFPNPGADQYFKLTFVDAATGLNNEIVSVTNVTGDTITMIRGQEGTAAQAWQAGDFASNLWTAGSAAAMLQQVQLNPTRIITASGAFVTTNADGSIGLNRTSGVAPSNTTLPDNCFAGQVIEYADLKGNFNGNPLTVFAPAGMTIAGADRAVMNVNKQVSPFKFYGSNLWSFKQ